VVTNPNQEQPRRLRLALPLKELSNRVRISINHNSTSDVTTVSATNHRRFALKHWAGEGFPTVQGARAKSVVTPLLLVPIPKGAGSIESLFNSDLQTDLHEQSRNENSAMSADTE